MRKKYIFGKKLYISILTSVVVLITTVATTFAWVGVFANSTFSQFDFSIRSSSLDEYGIEISLTGEEDSFSDYIPGEALKEQILLNWGYEKEFIDYQGIEETFRTLSMVQCTTLPATNGNELIKFGEFLDIEGNTTKAYFTFDLYISATRFFDSGVYSDFKLDAFLGDGLIEGSSKSRILINPFTYPSDFINPLSSVQLPTNIEPVLGGTRFTNAKVNSASVARLGFEKYPVVEKYHPEYYNDSVTPVSSVIYTGDKYDYPTKDTDTGVYEFGTILPDDLNLAIGYYNSTEWMYARNGIKSITLPDDIYQVRGPESITKDKIFSKDTNQLIDSSKESEKIGTNQMMKVRVSFWIEGWDADCFNVIGNSPITINISLSPKQEND